MKLLIKIFALIISAFGNHLIKYFLAEGKRKIKYEKPLEGKLMISDLGILKKETNVAFRSFGYSQFRVYERR